MTDEELNEKLEKSPGERVTNEGIDSVISHHEFLTSGVLTIAVITLVNGFNVIGESACVDPANYDPAIGQKIAYDNARNKIWLLEGYALAERRLTDRKLAEAFEKVKLTDAEMYVGTKALLAKPMTRAEYCKYRGWDVPADENGDDTGMIVQYSDGYISWTPTAQFDAAYHKVA